MIIRDKLITLITIKNRKIVLKLVEFLLKCLKHHTAFRHNILILLNIVH